MPFKQKLKYGLISSALILLSVISLRSSLNILKNKRRLEDIKNEVFNLEKEKLSLEESIEYKKSDEYIEERARNDLNLIKPGEQVYVIVGEQENKQVDVLSETDEQKKNTIKDSNPYMWYKLFF